MRVCDDDDVGETLVPHGAVHASQCFPLPELVQQCNAVTCANLFIMKHLSIPKRYEVIDGSGSGWGETLNTGRRHTLHLLFVGRMTWPMILLLVRFGLISKQERGRSLSELCP